MLAMLTTNFHLIKGDKAYIYNLEFSNEHKKNCTHAFLDTLYKTSCILLALPKILWKSIHFKRSINLFASNTSLPLLRFVNYYRYYNFLFVYEGGKIRVLHFFSKAHLNVLSLISIRIKLFNYRFPP